MCSQGCERTIRPQNKDQEQDRNDPMTKGPEDEAEPLEAPHGGRLELCEKLQDRRPDLSLHK